MNDLVDSAIIESFLYQMSPLLLVECDLTLVVISLSFPSVKRSTLLKAQAYRIWI